MKSIEEIHKSLINNEISPETLLNECVTKSKEIQKKCNAFITIIDKYKLEKVNENIISSIPFGISDNISTKDILSTSSSLSLKNYIPIFNATCVEKLLNKGAVISSKTNIDEYGKNNYGINGFNGVIKNPWNNEYVAGVGNACAVSYGVYPFAIGTEMSTEIRKSASYCCVVGYKPTYGLISRYGLFAYASSLDTIGVFTRNVKDAAYLVNEMKGKDEKDMTSVYSDDISLIDEIDKDIKNIKLCYIKELCNNEFKENLSKFMERIEEIRNMKITIEEISVDKNILDQIYNTHKIISNAEASSNLSNLTGIIFGPREEKENYIDMIKEYRTKNLSSEIKKSLILGSYTLYKNNKDKYFNNACKVRRLIVNTWKNIFKKYDAIISPILTTAPLIKEVKKVKNKYDKIDSHLLVSVLGGFPSITIPNGFINNIPIGINITSNIYEDAKLLNIAHKIEKQEYRNLTIKEEK